MKKTLLIALALIAVGCADAGQSAFCASLSQESSFEDVLPCAEQGNANAQYYLGFMYWTGQFVPEDPEDDDEEAFRLFRSSAEQGNANAQYYLGRMYDIGQFVPEDDEEAIRLYRSSAERGFVLAQFELGIRHASGFGVPEDIVLAYMFYNLAEAQGHDISRGYKDTLEEQMSTEQIAEAQRLSREWIARIPEAGTS